MFQFYFILCIWRHMYCQDSKSQGLMCVCLIQYTRLETFGSSSDTAVRINAKE